MAAKPVKRRMPSSEHSYIFYFPRMNISSEPASLHPAPVSRCIRCKNDQEHINV